MNGLLSRLYRTPAIFVGLVFLLAAQGGTVPIEAQGDPTIFVVNRANQSIYYLYVSPTSSDSWGRDLLGDDVISVGDRFRVAPARGNCQFDVKIVYADNQEEQRRNVNFCEISELVFSGASRAPASGNNADFDLLNRSSMVIYRLYVSPATSDSWGTDRLGDDTLRAGDRFTVRLPRDGTCNYDVKVEYRDSRIETRFNLNLCSLSEVAFDGSGATAPPSTNNPPAAPPNAGRPGPTPPSRTPTSLSWGTGFFVSGQGHALTNNHVAGECGTITAVVEGQRLPAQLIRRDEQNDLALVRVQVPQAVPFASFRLQSIRPLDTVVTAGFPLPNVLQNGMNFSTGNVSALSGIGGNAALLQISAPIQPGNSGGPVLDLGGNVVGVVVSQLTSAQNVNFAVQGAIARIFLQANAVQISERVMPDRPLAPAEVTDLAQRFTFQIECRP